MTLAVNQNDRSQIHRSDVRQEVGLQDAHPSPVGTPSLDLVVARICRDASDEAMRFVLRSDVGHDGE